MSVLDSLDAFATDTLTVERFNTGTLANGLYTPAAPTTFLIQATVQPAYNLNRVVGGADLHAMVDDQHVTEVRQLWTRTQLKTRTPITDPDVITGYQGANWTVVRVEEWAYATAGVNEYHYHVVISKQTGGAA